MFRSDETRSAIEITPPGSKRDKLEKLAGAGISMRRAKRGKHTVIELAFPDSGGVYDIWPIRTEADLNEPALLSKLHWEMHGNDGLDELRERVWGRTA